MEETFRPGVPMLFILGRGRSGSTLLQTMLDAHPGVRIPQESRFVQYLSYSYMGVRKWDDEQKKAFIKDLGRCFETPEMDAELLNSNLQKLPENASFAEACKAIYLSVRSPFKKSTTKLIGDKNPRYVFFIRRLLKIFPDAKFVHLYRDCRDSTLSFYGVKGMDFEKKQPAFLAYRWSYYNRQVMRAKSRYEGRFFALKYEDLVADPETQLRSICRFVDIDFEPEMLTYYRRINEVFDTESEIFRTIHSGLRTAPDTKKSGWWKTKMSERDVKITEAIAGTTLRKLGYETTTSSSKFKVYLVHLYWITAAALPLYFKKVFYGIPVIMRLFYFIKKGRRG
jgi:hypothetical protein